MQEPNSQPPAAPGSKPTNTKKIVIWILLILGILTIIVALIVGGATYYAYTKMKDMGLTPTQLGDDPGTAFGKILAATNDDIEFISSDKDKKIVTFRNRKTGETITVDFESIKAGNLPEGLTPAPDEDSGEDSPGEDAPEE